MIFVLEQSVKTWFTNSVPLCHASKSALSPFCPSIVAISSPVIAPIKTNVISASEHLLDNPVSTSVLVLGSASLVNSVEVDNVHPKSLTFSVIASNGDMK